MKKKINIKFGQVWKTLKDYQITENWSPQFNCIIPEGTRIVILNTPPNEAKSVLALPLTSKNLDRKLIPDLKEMERLKEGFGVAVDIIKMGEFFILDKNQQVEFDYPDGKEFWETILKHI